MSGVEQKLAQHKEEIDRLRKIVINDGGPATHEWRISNLEFQMQNIDKRHRENRKWLMGIAGGILAGLILQLLKLIHIGI